jgi:hypothetical protein
MPYVGWGDWRHKRSLHAVAVDHAREVKAVGNGPSNPLNLHRVLPASSVVHGQPPLTDTEIHKCDGGGVGRASASTPTARPT